MFVALNNQTNSTYIEIFQPTIIADSLLHPIVNVETDWIPKLKRLERKL